MISKSKLVVDCRMLNNSGIGRYINEVIPQIARYFEIEVIIHPNDLGFAQRWNLKPIILNSSIYTIKEQLDFLKLRVKGSVFWSPHYNVPVLPFKCAARVVTIHDVCHLALPQQLSVTKRIYAQQMIRKAVNLSDKIITVSEFSKQEIIRHTGCPENKIKVIHNGLKQTPGYENCDSVRARYGLPPKYILYVGNVKPHKNLKALFKAYLQLDRNIQNEYKVVIVGKKEGFITGDYELMQWVDTSVRLKDRIHFTGYVVDKDLDYIYAQASLFIFPSLYEGFGFPPLEAMLNKCPVISSGGSSLPEVCGSAALYFDPKDPNEICSKIQQVISSQILRDDLIKRGESQVKKFTWNRSISEHLNVINSIF